MSRQKRTFALDFDGVLHKYNGWQNGKIDGPIPGAREAVETLHRKGHSVVVFTTRPKATVEPWLYEHGFPPLEVTSEKLPFYVIVDDRGICFEGSWSGMVDKILSFEPYWVRERD